MGEDGQRREVKTPIGFYVDGGMIGRKNPSPKGVYYSVYRHDPNGVSARVISLQENHDYHTNNDAEWLALLAALKFAREHHPHEPIVIYSDSQIIVNQFNGRWRIRILRHRHFARTALRLAAPLHSCTVEWRSRKHMVKRLGH